MTVENNQNTDFLCLECGHINENNSELICQPCQTPLDKTFYDLLINYSLRAIRYGYNYRTNYERQVKSKGKINEKYSLLDPQNEVQWLAAAALSGVAGNLVYDTIKHVAKQIKIRLTEKSKTIELKQVDKDTFEIVSDEQTLAKFVLYIQNYYKGNAKLDKRVADAIAEEEIVHAMTEGKSEQLTNTLSKQENGKAMQKMFLEMFKNGAEEAKKLRQQGPTPQQLEKLFSLVKKNRGNPVDKKTKNKKASAKRKK